MPVAQGRLLAVSIYSHLGMDAVVLYQIGSSSKDKNYTLRPSVLYPPYQWL